MQSSEAGDEIARDKTRTPTIQLFLIVMLYFCDFHLMREPLNGRCCCLYFAWPLLNRSQRPPWQKICMVLSVVGKSQIESEGRAITKHDRKDVQQYSQPGMLLHIYCGDPHLLVLW